MQFKSGILLFIFCITFVVSPVFATPENAPAPSAPIIIQAPSAGEVLEKDYVSLELAPQDSVSISILKTVGSLLRILENKAYSLMNWRVYTRRNVEIANYDRIVNFGRWINDPSDETCYNTRAVVLMRDSVKPVVYKDTDKCVVATGRWNDPYTGKVFKATEDIQIDHVVPLKNAFISGAYAWSFRARCLYANYLGEEFHLMSVNGSENMKKGDKSPERYMPPNKAHACTYLKHWLSIKFLWGLKMTVSEADGITALLKEHQCDLRSFRMSQKEILSQAAFTRDNIDLCDKIDAARNNSGMPVAN